jgi:hypothetical protein
MLQLFGYRWYGVKNLQLDIVFVENSSVNGFPDSWSGPHLLWSKSNKGKIGISKLRIFYLIQSLKEIC